MQMLVSAGRLSISRRSTRHPSRGRPRKRHGDELICPTRQQKLAPNQNQWKETLGQLLAQNYVTVAHWARRLWCPHSLRQWNYPPKQRFPPHAVIYLPGGNDKIQPEHEPHLSSDRALSTARR